DEGRRRVRRPLQDCVGARGRDAAARDFGKHRIEVAMPASENEAAATTVAASNRSGRRKRTRGRPKNHEFVFTMRRALVAAASNRGMRYEPASLQRNFFVAGTVESSGINRVTARGESTPRTRVVSTFPHARDKSFERVAAGLTDT